MKPTPDRPRFALELEALPSDAPPETRLKRLLKFALRALQLRAVSVRPVPEQAPVPPEPPQGP